MLKVDIEFDSTNLKKYIEYNFGYGSEAQKNWSMLVFETTAYTVPYEYGDMLRESRIASEELYSQGMIVYTKTTPSGKNVALDLWNGVVQIAGFGYSVVKNWTNPNTTPEWTLTALPKHIDYMEEIMQEWINGGF